MSRTVTARSPVKSPGSRQSYWATAVRRSSFVTTLFGAACACTVPHEYHVQHVDNAITGHVARQAPIVSDYCGVVRVHSQLQFSFAVGLGLVPHKPIGEVVSPAACAWQDRRGGQSRELLICADARMPVGTVLFIAAQRKRLDKLPGKCPTSTQHFRHSSGAGMGLSGEAG